MRRCPAYPARVAITACGGSSKLTASGRGGKSTTLVGFAVCMRTHGVPNLPDPGAGSGAGGVSILPAGINPSTPALRTAWAACSTLLPGLGAHHGPSAQAIQQTLRFSECMRSHGVSGFPDPTATPPSGFDPTATPESSDHEHTAVIRRGGAWLAIGATIRMTSPTYEPAASARRFGPKFS